MKTRLKPLLLALAIFPCCANCQIRQSYSDSLRKVLSIMPNDKGRVAVQNKLAIALKSTDPEAALGYAREAWALSAKLGDAAGRAKAADNLGGINYSLGNYDSSLFYARYYLAVSRGDNDKAGIATALTNIGNVYLDKGLLDSSLSYHRRSLAVETELGRKKGMGDSYNNIGLVFQARAQLDSALYYFMQDMKMSIAIKDSSAIGDAYTNIGTVYFQQGVYDKAIENHQLSIEYKTKMGDKQGVGYALNNIANACVMKGSYDQAIDYYRKALSLLEAVGNKKGIIGCVDNIGAVYFELKNYPEAAKFFLRSKRYAEESGNAEGVANVLINLGMAEAGMRHYGAATGYIKQGLEASKAIGAKDRIRDAYKCLSEVYTATSDYKSAFEAFVQYDAIKDTIRDEVAAKNVAELHVQYETEKKNNENALLKKDREIIAANLSTQRTRNTALSISIVSILLVGSFSFYTWKRRKTYAFQKQLGEAKQEALNAQMSDHFIGNTIDSINCFIETNEKDKASHHLILFSRLIRRVLDNSFKKQITLKEELDVLEDYLQLESLRFEAGRFCYEVVIGDDINTESALIPPMVLQVLAENALKHGFDKQTGGKLQVRIMKNGESITCAVEDNGRGIAPAIPQEQTGMKLRKSYGSHLAERLIKTFGENARSSFNIYNLGSKEPNAIGTRAEFTIPYRLAF